MDDTDTVTEIKDLVFSDHNSAKIIKDDEERLKVNGGVINNLISALVTKDDEGKADKNGEEKESGILNNLISNLVSPRVKESSTDDTFGGDDDEEKGKDGIFNNFISGILQQNDEETKEKNGVENDKLQAGDGGGGSLIDNIVSHLPSPLSDDAAPATDEASILITSIVHD